MGFEGCDAEVKVLPFAHSRLLYLPTLARVTTRCSVARLSSYEAHHTGLCKPKHAHTRRLIIIQAPPGAAAGGVAQGAVVQGTVVQGTVVQPPSTGSQFSTLSTSAGPSATDEEAPMFTR